VNAVSSTLVASRSSSQKAHSFAARLSSPLLPIISSLSRLLLPKLQIGCSPFITAVANLLGEELNSTRPPHSPFSLAQSSSIALSSSKLHRLSLPTFDGKFAEYKNFINSFTQIIALEVTVSNLESSKTQSRRFQ